MGSTRLLLHQLLLLRLEGLAEVGDIQRDHFVSYVMRQVLSDLLRYMMRMFSVLVNSMMKLVKCSVLTSMYSMFAPTLLTHYKGTCRSA